MILLNGLIFFISQHGKTRQHFLMLTNVFDAFLLDEQTLLLFIYFVKLSIIVMIEKLTYLMLYFLTLPKIVLITPTRLDL